MQSVTQDGVTVELRIPTDDEAERPFGLSLAERGMQAIWLRLENRSDTDYWLLPIALDPDYYSADEAALLAGRRLSTERRTSLTDTFRQQARPFFLKAGAVDEGFVYAVSRRHSWKAPGTNRMRKVVSWGGMGHGAGRRGGSSASATSISAQSSGATPQRSSRNRARPSEMPGWPRKAKCIAGPAPRCAVRR